MHKKKLQKMQELILTVVVDCMMFHIFFMHSPWGGLPKEPVILQQLWTARCFSGRVIRAIPPLRRRCEPLQMPTHRNVLPAHPRTWNIVVVIELAFLVGENQPTNRTCHDFIK
jgi:hypothetical protein